MARLYPRFLFSDPQNTKSKGPFVVHTLDPKFIVKVCRVPVYGSSLPTTTDGTFCLLFVEGSRYGEPLKNATDALFAWLHKQVAAGEINI